WLAEKWQPYVNQIDYILSNSASLIRHVENLAFNSSMYLATVDVEKLYPSIQHDDATRLIYVFLARNSRRLDIDVSTLNFEIEVMAWICKYSFVTFRNVTYRQTKGIAMGTSAGPVIANLYLAALEEDFSSKPIFYVPIVYWRYLDDIFVIVEDINDCGLFALNYEVASDRAIKVTVADKGDSVDYLDLTIFKVTDLNHTTRLAVKNYIKPMNRHIYTDPRSFYPYNYIYGWIQGENI